MTELHDIGPFPLYLALYSLAAGVHFVKLRMDSSRGAVTTSQIAQSSGGAKTQWWNYTYFGLDIINVAAGVIVFVVTTLVATAPTLSAALILGYIVLILVAIYGDSFSIKIRSTFNAIVIIVFVSSTYYIFHSVPAASTASHSGGDSPAQDKYWRVSIPYHDSGLERHISRNTRIINYFVKDVTAKSRDDAVQAAVRVFHSDDGPPIFREPGATPRDGTRDGNIHEITNGIIAESSDGEKIALYDVVPQYDLLPAYGASNTQNHRPSSDKHKAHSR